MKRWTIYSVEASANERRDIYFSGLYYLDNIHYKQEEFEIDVYRGSHAGNMSFRVSFNSKTKLFHGRIVFAGGLNSEYKTKVSGRRKNRMLLTVKEYSLIVTRNGENNNPKNRQGRHWRKTLPYSDRFHWGWLRPDESDGDSFFRINTDMNP